MKPTQLVLPAVLALLLGALLGVLLWLAPCC
jgi:hypothetical protein